MAELQREITLREVCHGYFDDAKIWWIVGLSCKLASPIIGAVLVVWNLVPAAAPLTVLALALIAELCTWRSDVLRGCAESWLRKLDLYDSFNWEITAEEQADVIADLSRRQQNRFLAKEVARDYFGSAEPPGPRRALGNVKESAWWSKRLAKQMGHFCLAMAVLAFVGTMVALLVTVQSARSITVLPKVGRFVIAVLLAVLSVGVLRLAASYYGFSAKAADREAQAGDCLGSSAPDAVAAIRLWQEYHLERAAAPMLPTHLWRLRRREWNAVWKRLFSRRGEGEGG